MQNFFWWKTFSVESISLENWSLAVILKNDAENIFRYLVHTNEGIPSDHIFQGISSNTCWTFEISNNDISFHIIFEFNIFNLQIKSFVVKDFYFLKK